MNNDVIKNKNHRSLGGFLVRETGLEPVRLATHAPQTCLSASSSTLAYPTCAFYSHVEYYNIRMGKVNRFFHLGTATLSLSLIHIWLTGNTGAGKSTVAAALAQQGGAVLLDADAIARRLQQPGSETLEAIAQRFGTQMLQPDGSLNRTALGLSLIHISICE